MENVEAGSQVAAEEAQGAEGQAEKGTGTQSTLSQELLNTLTQSREFVRSEFLQHFSSVREELKSQLYKEVLSSVTEELNKRYKSLELQASQYKLKDESEEGIESIIEGAKKLKVTR